MKLIVPIKDRIETDPISLRLEHALLKQFDTELDKLGITRSEAIRQLIMQYLESVK